MNPKPARADFRSVKKQFIFIAFLALGRSWGRLGGGRKTDRKTELKKVAHGRHFRAVRRDVRGPAEGYGEVNSPGTGLETRWILKTPSIRWMRRI